MLIAEKAVYGILKFLISFLLLLYVYLVYEKLKEIVFESRRKKESSVINGIIDALFVKLSNSENIEKDVVDLKKYAKTFTGREIAAERLMGYIELIRGDLRNALSRICEELGFVDYEMANLKKRDTFRIALACRRLGEYRSEKPLELLLDKLKTDVYEVKYNALLAISKIGNNEYFLKAFSQEYKVQMLSERNLMEIANSFEGDKAAIYKKMINHENEYLSSIFIRAAGNDRILEVSEEVGRHLASQSFLRKIAAIKAAGQMGDFRHADKIIKELSDPDWRIRAVAAKSLGELGAPGAGVHLKEALKDSEWWVRYNAAFSIIKLGNYEDVLEEIFSGRDEFAKDAAFYALETAGLIKERASASDLASGNLKPFDLKLKQYMEKKGLQYEHN
ncbi:MAG: HEAT repeat domain-containing protein [Tepidanaerobacteraceae bacterium]|jgi:HEAT repeat protein|nr:HEAT repeat domain-containing protein [Tepidanaerobacteraceae bacterium]